MSVSARPLDGYAATAHTAVMGLQFGDEGKGQIVDRLTAEHDLVVRYNGGANAGHTVRLGEERFALHLLPSGVLSPDKTNVIGNGVVVDPAGLLNEIDGLAERGVSLDGRLKLSSRAHLVMPWHQREDALMEAAAAVLGTDAIGTTGRGIGPAYADKAMRSTAVRADELLDRVRLRARLAPIIELKNLLLGSLAQRIGQDFEPFDAAAVTETFAGYGDRLRPYVTDTTALLHEASAAGQRILFEGANAVMLDIDHGTYPFVTSSNASALGIPAGAGIPPSWVNRVYGVVKGYTSRVGAGPFPTELSGELADTIRDLGQEYGTTTGRPRRCGWLDLVAVGYGARLCGVTDLVLTGLSVLSGLDRVRACVEYRLHGERLTTLPADAAALAEAEPVYEEVDGWGPLDECTGYEDLPAAARAYVDLVAAHVAPVSLVCIGRRRDQVLAVRA
jgi:adenylosuccinate synthase